MDDDKSIIQKIANGVKEVVDSVTEAALQAMIPAKTASPDPAHVAGTTNEQMLIPDAAALPQMAPTPPERVSDKQHVEKILKDAAARPARKRTKAPAKKSKSPINKKAVSKKKVAKKTKKSKR